MRGIFISYRREDTRAYARTLSEALAARFGPDDIFRDVDSLMPGADFPDAIANADRHRPGDRTGGRSGSAAV